MHPPTLLHCVLVGTGQALAFIAVVVAIIFMALTCFYVAEKLHRPKTALAMATLYAFVIISAIATLSCMGVLK